MLFTDQLGRNLDLPTVPKRIISLVPSQTEFLYDIGLGDSIVGQTLFCVHPAEAFKKANKIGGTKKLNMNKIRSLKPDFIIANKEENSQSQILELEKEYPVWISDIKTLQDALEMMQKLGEILDKKTETAVIVNAIQNRFTKAPSELGSANSKTVLYLIWQKPWMAAGQDTFINTLIHCAGYQNAIKDPGSRYPNLFLEDMKALNPDCIFLSSEPFPFDFSHVDYLKSELPHCNIQLVDGEMFSWYGSRLLKAADYFGTLV